jgi:hypothetical protein
MMRRPSPFEIALVAVGILILGIAGYVGEERGQTAIDTYSSYDARSGGYQAWYELLEREGVDVERFERAAAFLDGSIGTLIVSEPLPFDPSAVAPTDLDALAIDNWIAAGGTIIALGESQPASQSPLRRVRFATLSTARLRAMGVHTAVSSTRPIARIGTYGHGTVVLVQDEGMFANGKIASADNARLAFALARLQPRSGGVAFYETIHGYLVPEHWWLVAPRRLVIAIAVAALVAAIALFGAAIRLGPPLIAPSRREATSLEYLDAVASLYARARAVRQAITDTLHAVKRTVATALGLPDDLPAHVLARGIVGPDLRGALAELDVLATMPTPNERHLVRASHLAYLIRKEYVSHGRGI